MYRRALRCAERSELYGAIIDPPPPPPIVLAEANGPPALTAFQREQLVARKHTIPAPKCRRRGPRGRLFHRELFKAEE